MEISRNEEPEMNLKCKGKAVFLRIREVKICQEILTVSKDGIWNRNRNDGTDQMSGSKSGGSDYGGQIRF